MHTNLYIGVMSGTSLDGVDIALMDFSKRLPRFVTGAFTPMPPDLRQHLGSLLKSGKTSLQRLGELDHRMGLLYADATNRFLAQQQLRPDDIQAIGCHGQTVWHSPNGKFPFTMQVGDMNLVATLTGITTVGDFRRKDMAAGGQGAPLVPAFHESLFACPERQTVVLNIGGISNISVLDSQTPTIGYDVGAGNALLDVWVEQCLGKPYDKNGEWAKTGYFSTALLTDLLNDPFFRQPPPKSTGRELFNLAWLTEKCRRYPALAPQDVQRTLVEFTAVSIANELHRLPPTDLPKRLIVCGGGTKNPLIMQRLADLLPDWRVTTTDEFGLDADFVEAAAFAWLAYRRMHNLPSNLPAVTGAKQTVSLGVIYPKD